MNQNESQGPKDTLPPPPDITRDRVYHFCGGTLFLRANTHVAALDPAAVWATFVPVEEDSAVAVYPREVYIRVLHQLTIGTVAELVEEYRQKLTNAWHALTCAPKDGEEQPVIPQMGEPSLRRQNEVLERHGINKLTDILKVGVWTLNAREERRRTLTGFTPRQNAYTRDLLMRLVAQWAGRSYPDPDDAGQGLVPPSDNVDRIDRLITALTILKEDRLAMGKSE